MAQTKIERHVTAQSSRADTLRRLAVKMEELRCLCPDAERAWWALEGYVEWELADAERSADNPPERPMSQRRG